MAMGGRPWEAASILVRLGGVIGICCDIPPLLEQPYQQNYHQNYQQNYAHGYQDYNKVRLMLSPWIITDSDILTWEERLQRSQFDAELAKEERFTIIPTITNEYPWDEELYLSHSANKDMINDKISLQNDFVSTLIKPTPVLWSIGTTTDDQEKSRSLISQIIPALVNPTPVFWSSNIATKLNHKQKYFSEIPKNLSGRFFDMLRAAVVKAEHDEANNYNYHYDQQSHDEANNYNYHYDQQSHDDANSYNYHYDQQRNEESSNNNYQNNHFLQHDSVPYQMKVPAYRSKNNMIGVPEGSTSNQILQYLQPTQEEKVQFTPLLQVCVVLGVLVILCVIIFHQHHFRRECLAERRALQRFKKSLKMEEVEGNIDAMNANRIAVDGCRFTDVTL